MKIKSFSPICSIFLVSICMGGNSQPSIMMLTPDRKQQEFVKKLGPPSVGMARIIFNRQSNLFGAVVPHFIVDRRDSAINNAFIAQDEEVADSDGDFDMARNVTQIYLKDDKMRFHLILGQPLPGDIVLTDKNEIANTKLTFANIVVGLDDYELKSNAYRDFSKPLVPNARLVGVIKSGGSVVWERHPGKTRIEVIPPNGDQAFCPPFNVEEGGTYFVDYYYMKASFKVAEVK
jgi:hypothetical protein